MAEKSRTLDGDRQEDGWGMSWLDAEAGWRCHRSLQSIWSDQDSPAGMLPGPVSTLAIHARSASFSRHKHNLEFNQPFTHGRYVFVFNGLLKGVASPQPLPGVIGAQKIFHLLSEELKYLPADKALNNLGQWLNEHAKEVTGCNIGLSDGRTIYGWSDQTGSTEYFQLWSGTGRGISLLSSQPLENDVEWSAVPRRTGLQLPCAG